MGKIQYQTQVSLWTGSQPARFDLSSGLARRFYFIEFIPTAQDKEIIRNMRRLGQNIMPKARQQLDIGKKVVTLCKKLKRVNHIAFDQTLHSYFNRYKILHFEEPLYERVALGHTIMTGNFDEQIIVKLTPEIQNIIHQGMTWRKSIKMDSEINQLVVLMKDNKGKLLRSDAILGLSDFGVDYIR